MTAWILSLLLMLAPPEQYVVHHARFGLETVGEREARYLSIAIDIAEELEEVPEHRRRWLGALLVSVAYLESGFAPDVDLGPCAPVRGRCDGGRAVSLWQLHGHPEQAGDRPAAVATAIDQILQSASACRRYGPDAILRVYASGSCERGAAASARRVTLARRLVLFH